MSKTAFFWRNTKINAEKLLEHHVSYTIEGLDNERSKQLTQSSTFKLSVIKYYGYWVAFKSICCEVQTTMVPVQHEIHQYIRENPAKEEAERIIKRLKANIDQQ